MEQLKQLVLEELKKLEGLVETGSSAAFTSYHSGVHHTLLTVIGWINKIESPDGEVPTEV
jgi:hypothetical protein